MTEVKSKINDLFNKMVNEVKKEGLRIEISHRSPKTKRMISFSGTIGDFRIKALEIAKNNPYNWSLEDRNSFSQGFGRKTSKYYWLKKELLLEDNK